MHDSFTPLSQDDKLLAMLCHLSLFLGCGLLAPLVIYVIKKDTPVGEHAREALNFHITLLIISFVGAILSLICIGYLILLGGVIFGMVMAIIAVIRLGENAPFHYPFCIRLI